MSKKESFAMIAVMEQFFSRRVQLWGWKNVVLWQQNNAADKAGRCFDFDLKIFHHFAADLKSFYFAADLKSFYFVADLKSCCFAVDLKSFHLQLLTFLQNIWEPLVVGLTRFCQSTTLVSFCLTNSFALENFNHQYMSYEKLLADWHLI